VGRQIVADNHLDVIVWQGLDMSQENLSSRVLHTGTLGTGDQKKLTQRAKLPLNMMHFLFVQRMRKNVLFFYGKNAFFGGEKLFIKLASLFQQFKGCTVLYLVVKPCLLKPQVEH
jgi:hypothetical protein